jgi:uncharacterized membrane protein YhiD involved in acid resistance
MHEFLSSTFGDSLFNASPWAVLARVCVASLLGGVIAWIHRRTTPQSNGAGFPMQSTLVLLAALIAMVTQVIGDNVARAFSLVGALSIVRFRTSVRDTRDTAFVIFAVAVGMAVGAMAPWVALSGIVVIGATAFLLSRLSPESAAANDAEAEPFVLILRAQPDWDLEPAAGAILDRHLATRRVHAIRTAKQGASMDYSYDVTMRPDGAPHELVRVLSRIPGVQEVRFLRHGSDEEAMK